MNGQAAAAFVAAWRSGDPARMVDALDADAVLVCDTGGLVAGPHEPVNGAVAIAGWMLARFAPGGHTLTVTTANVRPAIRVLRAGVPVGTVVLRADGDRLTMLWLTLNPEKLRASP